MNAEVKIITANIPFQVTPNLEKSESDIKKDDEGRFIDEIEIFEPNLSIRGSIRFKEIMPYLWSDAPAVFPAGPALPFKIEVKLSHLNQEQLDSTEFNISYGETTYNGDGEYDDIELRQEGSATLNFWSWIEDDVEVQPLFPREALPRISYTLKV